jgi:hypothetical protein
MILTETRNALALGWGKKGKGGLWGGEGGLYRVGLRLKILADRAGVEVFLLSMFLLGYEWNGI